MKNNSRHLGPRLGLLLLDTECLGCWNRAATRFVRIVSLPLAREKVQEHPARQIAGYCDPDQWQCAGLLSTRTSFASRMKKYRINVIPCPQLFPGPLKRQSIMYSEWKRRGHFFSYLFCSPPSFWFCFFRRVDRAPSRSISIHFFRNFRSFLLSRGSCSDFLYFQIL